MTEWPSHFRAARTRSPWLLYAAVLASGGIFAWAWIFLLMQDVNRLKRRSVFNTALYFSVFCSVLALYFALIFWSPLPGTDPPRLSPLRLGLILSAGLALLVFPAVVIVQVNNEITTALSSKSRSLDAIAIVLLTFLIFISLIVIQLRLNELIRTRTARNEGV
jgi:cytochrome bd-type quinol oxidase subunit 2